jgi:hypothetical protein
MLKLRVAYLISWPSHEKFFDISRLSDWPFREVINVMSNMVKYLFLVDPPSFSTPGSAIWTLRRLTNRTSSLQKGFSRNPTSPSLLMGLGSRMCVGYVLGNRQLYILFLRLISTFRIIPDTQTDVSSYDPVKGVFDSKTLVSQPNKFRCHFIPRNDKIEEWL